jgi:hypothetical protein
MYTKPLLSQPFPLHLPRPLPIIPLTNRIPPYQTPSPHIVTRAKQLRNIDVQRAIRLSTSKQLMYTRHSCRNRVRGCPRRLQQVEADLACFEIYVWVADGRYEADCGRGERVGCRYRDGEEPAAV